MPPTDPHKTADLQHNPTTLDPRVARSLLRYEIQLMCRNTTHAEMGKRLDVSRASFTQLLSGKNLPSQPTLEVLATHFDQLSRLPMLIRLLNQAKTRSTDSAPITQAQNGELAIGLYQTAKTITAFDTYLVNPALRTSAYSSALRAYPIHSNKASALAWYVGEHVLHRQVGSAETMRQQRTHLATLANCGHIDIRIIPLKSSPPSSLVSAFVKFETENHRIIYEETNYTALYYDHIEDVAPYEDHIESLNKQALNPTQSRALIINMTN